MIHFRRSARLLLALPLVFPLATSAEFSPHLYLGATLGEARGSVGEAQINTQLAELGYDAEAEVRGRSRGAWSVLAGYQWSRYFATEAGFTDLGEVRTQLTGVAEDIHSFLDSANRIHPRSSSGYELAMLARYPLNEHLSVYARAGVLFGHSQYRARAQAASAGRDDSENTPIYGLGLHYDISPHWAMRAAWNRYDVESEAIGMLGASVVYKFGGASAARSATPSASDFGRPATAVTASTDCSGQAGPSVDSCAPELTQPVTLELEVRFDTGSARVDAQYFAEIEKVARFLQRYPEASATIEGHTDARGSTAYNQQLSERRARAVRDVLVEHLGVQAQRLEAAGFGESRLRAEGDSEAAHRSNRRVIARVMPNSQVP